MINGNQGFETTINKVVRMPQESELCDRVRILGLNIVNVMWEDTARTAGSVWGPNITDMTLQVRHGNNSQKKELLPVIRYPNFTDKTGDVPLEYVYLKVGNQQGEDLEAIELKEYLNHLPEYISYPEKYDPENKPLVTDKDTHVLVSAQACFLPIPQQGKCEFNPVLFNYQSRKDSPAVLAILITTEGSSATVLDNNSDRAQWGQNIYFNNNGQKTCLTGERLSDYKDNQAQELASHQGISLEEARSQVTVAEDVNRVMIVQVPLKQKQAPDFLSLAAGSCDFMVEEKCRGITLGAASDMEDAVIGYGEDEGEHLELGGHKLERDPNYPIRITVQFYKATSNAIIDDEDLVNIHNCIEKAYTSADYIGSLVIGTLEKGNLAMGEARPTQPAPSTKPVLGPPKDFLQVVNPFAPHQKSKT
ncbi:MULTISPECIES: hypothetical protein [unclassified Roseofilum]|uniref:hypothetical protein n=1 Tax=unclassified Roseofilum TaxID=2620099 RepID=UPI000E7EA93E|nr:MULTISPECIES: hypothetical protein [unclassified Roseofilum]MBP0009946.1 hypothetical protein [Roseofilum sp. Belize Diploria]MBP0034072.1 hypothetical protein [Roseofilum sp. Belize BBD 4]HBQ99273.1 hypothetical protein [Cyanobacteria bacterium UBA11691]